MISEKAMSINRSSFGCSTHFLNKRALPAFLVILSIVISGCSVGNSDSFGPNDKFEFDFRESELGWESFFTDYNVDNEDGMELQSGYRQLPEPLNTSDRALYISAVNQSDDVQMMFRRQVADSSRMPHIVCSSE